MWRHFKSSIRLAFALGAIDVARVLRHRLLKSLRYYEWRSPIRHFAASELLVADRGIVSDGRISATVERQAAALLAGEYQPFGGRAVNLTKRPRWKINIIDGREGRDFSDHWSRIPDFSDAVGDIKCVWELSRFSWLLTLARAYRRSGRAVYLDTANDWLSDWLRNNAVNQGPNWMCAQETSIRLIHLLLADYFLRQESQPSGDLEQVVCAHCRRISLTRAYGLALNNNHGISEAAGLFIGGSWLENSASEAQLRQCGKMYRRMGRRQLERLVRKLVLPDGTFAQYSVNYHRMLLDTLSIVEVWRRQNDLSEFSADFYSRCRGATRWLWELVDPASGDAPNVGANDGALVYRLADSPHCDFRPSVQLAMHLFCGQTAYEPSGNWSEPLYWLEMEPQSTRSEHAASVCFAHGGFAVLRSSPDTGRMVCRFPNFVFRPSQSDALHADFWLDGENILRDGGSFSYAADFSDRAYFMGTASHNTCQFDNRDQMPQVGRFLFSSWLRSRDLAFHADAARTSWTAAYSDSWGCSHSRRVNATPDGWEIADRVAGPFKTAVLRWRLSPNVAWYIEGNRLISDRIVLTVSSSEDIEDMHIRDGWESRIYMEKTTLPVLEIALRPCQQQVVSSIIVARRAS